MTEDNTNNNAVFAVLKPLCDNLILNVNQQSINDLSHALSNLPPKAIQKFQTYICFPIEVQIHKSSCALKKQMLVDILKKLVSLTYIESVSMLQRLSALLFQQVTGITRDQVSVSLVPEELKLSVVQCLDLLWRSAMSDVLHQIYTREHYPQLSPVIYMLVQLVRSEKLIKLRVASLECLLVVCYIHDSADRSDIEMCHRARDVVMLMMPGIVSCCTAVASESSTQNHSITIANMRVWSSVVSLVMEDQEPAVEQVKDTTSSPSNATTAAERVQQMKQQLRTAEWLHTTAEKLTTVTDALLRAQSHTHWQVRRQLAMSTKQLLTSCPRNLSLSVGSLVCCLIVLSEDEMPEVQQPATKALQEFSQKVELDTGQPLLELVESAFFSLLTRVPRIMQGTDDNSQMTCMSLLVGFLRLQGHKLPQVLCLSSFLHRLLMTLVHVSRLDCSHISLLEDCSVREVESNQVVTESWKKLMFCDSTQKALKLQNVCAMLRLYTDLQVITHALLDLLDSNPEHSKEIIFLLNSILAGGGLGSMTDQSELIRTVVNIYLQPNVWSVPISVGNQTAITVPEAQSNIVQISLLAEGLGLFALAVGGQNFSLCLMRCLYPLLECAGSALYPLASAGLLAVQNVAQACVNGGVTELVKANVDYLSHHITIRLRRAHENPGVLSVLSVVMRHTTIQVLPSLQEIIEDVWGLNLKF